jgi:hypothetical protein
MKYDITKQTAYAMPTIGKDRKCVKNLLFQASKDMEKPLFWCFSLFFAHSDFP